ncbi:hypothetical protein [Cytophaga hutchinsonii]|uniref:Uncharacterized protein n=1 Tax=Cytophaga hutchinsonii (strain ATCC 33406 / DSM 1761 / CIP 103989 / NBRC 15051 / NCIMB 9469 / D465) TaxID=269798 RepID=A0A6N4SRX9_CYTH3|nr:hypothetical protein [Cytophaga hutchinsonii]ABG59132.1 hypothetical protein CHU_1866 [Cytophaga hutchinsonii ATCC 33406]SFX36010.1 hypothetical protein SAMN04487930_103176 [Cytophaga hutchinsonii ATCC 33406]
MKNHLQLFNEISTVDYLSEYLKKCFSQVFDQDVLHLSEDEIKMLAKALAGKHKIEEIPLSILKEYKRIDPPVSKCVSKVEFDGGGTYYVFIRYQIAHSVQNLTLLELYPKNFHKNIIDKRDSEITENHIEFHVNSNHCSENIPDHKKLLIVQKREEIIADIRIKVQGINEETGEFNNELEDKFVVFLTNMKNDLINKKNRFNGL